MKKQLFCIFFVFLLFSGFVGIAFGSWIPDGNKDTISNNISMGVSGLQNVMFYVASEDRYYAGYWYSTNGYLYYSYTDSGDYSAWNSGGSTGIVLKANPNNGLFVGNLYSWVYDNNNEIGYLTYVRCNTGYWYARNFTTSAGSISLGSEITLAKSSTGGAGVNLEFIENVVYAGISGWVDTGAGLTVANMVVKSTDGFATTMALTWDSGLYSTSNSIIFPVSEMEVIQVSASAYATSEAQLRAKLLNFGKDSNGTDTGTAFSDNALYALTATNTVHFNFWGGSYNSTHGCLVYEALSRDCYAFVFDFATMTRGSESMVLDGSGATVAHLSVTVNLNEFFVFWCDSAKKDLVMVEQHDPLYEGIFNATAADFVYENAYTTQDPFSYNGANIMRIAEDNDGFVLCCFEGDSNTLFSTGVIVEGEYPTSEDYFTLTADLEDIDDDGADWVFTNWKYYSFNFETNMQPENVSISFTVPVGEENVAGGFWTDGEEWIYASNMSYESREGEPFQLRSGLWSFNSTGDNVTTGSFLIWFDNRILDVWLDSDAVTVYYSLDAAAVSTDSGLDFRIYSKGGFEMNLDAVGSAGKLTGGTPFNLYASNGSSAYNEIWYRDAQHIKILPEVHFLAGLESFSLYYGFDYSLGDGEWLPGAFLQIHPDTVSYTGLFAGNVWINGTYLFYNRVEYLQDFEYLYMFYHGSVSGEGDPGYFQPWVDFWISDKNASSVGNGRVNAFEYPMIDDADLWLRWLANNWGVKDDVEKELSVEFPLLDSDDETIISSQKIKMIRFWCNLTVEDSDGGQLIEVKNYAAFDITHSKQLPMVGISSPVFDETKVPTVGNTGLLGALWSMFAGLGSWLSENVIFGGLNMWGTFVNFLDTIAGWVGAPKFFTNLFTWIGESVGYLGTSFEYLINIMADVFDLFSSLLGAFLDTMGQLITSIVGTVTMFTDMMGGAYGAGVNIWETLGVGQWITIALIFYPLYLVILWEESGMDAVIQQLTWLFGLLTWIFEFMSGVIREAIMLITSLIESIPVAE